MKKLVAGAGIGLLGAAGAVAGVRSSRKGASFSPSPAAKRVVVLGAGFGGMTAAKQIAAKRGDHDLDVLLVDRHNYHLYTPILYQVATGGVGPDNIAHPIRYVARTSGFRFQESSVERIDLEGRCVYTDDGELPYDYLVVALGAVTNYFGIEAVQEHSLPLKTLGDGIAIRNRVIDAFERAEVATDPEERKALLTFAIVGAGATGVELATSIRDLATHTLLKDYPGIDPADVRVMLVEAIDKVLPGIAPPLAENAVITMKKKGVEIRTSTPVTAIEPDGFHTKDGEFIPSKTVVWAAGVRATSVIGDLPGDKGRDGRVAVNPFLQLPDHPEVYAVGDAAMYIPAGQERPLPPNAPVAIAQGKTVAANVLHALNDEPFEDLNYKRQGELVSVGRSNALADLQGYGRINFSKSLYLTGLPGWLAWRAIYVGKLTGMKNRTGVLADWAFGLIHQRETNRLDMR